MNKKVVAVLILNKILSSCDSWLGRDSYLRQFGKFNLGIRESSVSTYNYLIHLAYVAFLSQL